MSPLRALVAAVALLLAAAAPAQAGRPDYDGSGVYGQPNWTVDEAAGSPHCSLRACVHWVSTTDDAPADLSDGDADGVPDSVEYALDGAGRALAKMVGPGPGSLGWRAPMGDGALGGGTDLVDVYVKDLHGRAAGVAPVDWPQNSTDNYPRYHGYVIIDDDYLAKPYWGNIQRKLVPHEVQHLIEDAYDGWFESWLGESTAEWSVSQTDGEFALLSGYPAAWGSATAFPMAGVRDPNTHAPPPKAYASVMWQRWLEHRYGAGLLREVWERAAAASPVSFAPNLVDEALAGESTFFDEFTSFSVGNAEWRAADDDFGGDPGVAEVERVGTLVPGGDGTTRTLDHTTFALLDVPVGDAAAYELRARVPSGTSGAVALVGRVGDADGGTIETAVQRLPDGGEARVGLADPARFARVTAVLVNADTSISNPDKAVPDEWDYTRDDQVFGAQVLRAERTPPPPPEPESPLAPAPDPAVAERPSVPPPIVVEDLVAPKLTLARFGRGVLRRLRAGRALRVRALVDEPSELVVELRSGATAIRKVVVARSALRARTVSFRLNRAARRRLARAARGRALTLTVIARDAAGNARTVTRRLAR